LYVCQSVLKGDFVNETILTILVSNSCREGYLGDESWRRLYKADNMIWKMIILMEPVKLILTWLGEELEILDVIVIWVIWSKCDRCRVSRVYSTH